MKFSRAILFLLIGFFAAQTIWYYPNLPERVATHFDVSGAPNGWMQKPDFLIFEAVILIFVTGGFMILSLLIEKMPDSIINLPNKKYWLAGERRAQTFAVIRTYFEWFTVAILALFIAVNQLVFRANLDNANLSSESWLLVGAFLLFVILWMIKFVRQFKINN